MARIRRPALERFAEKCRFEPHTGCVVWIGGTTSGQGGGKGVYGSFKDAGRRWFAHRWAAKFIHGFDIDGLQVDHCCEHTGGLPNRLCVQHVRPETSERNRELQDIRRREVQNADQRQFWLFVHRGFEQLPEVEPSASEPDIPIFTPPAWLVPFLPAAPAMAECPF